MPEEKQLRQRLEELKQRWTTLSEVIQALQKDHDLETREAEKLRLHKQISAKKADRRTVEAEMEALEAELKPLQKAELVQDAGKFERNGAYAEAIQTWQEALQLDPKDRSIMGEIERLEERQRESERIDELIRGITRRLKEIQPVYLSVVKWLRQHKEMGAGENTILELIECFLDKTLPPEAFQDAWRDFESAPKEPSRTVGFNYSAFAQRLQHGDIVLFLGSDMASELATDTPSTQTVVSDLARQARFDSFTGSLSKIAEYYQITEYGRSSLVANLDGLIGATSPEISLYSRLAELERPLTIISASYDSLLENAFRVKGKRFMLVSAFIRGTPDYDVGTLRVEYSDRDQPESPCQGEDLSGLEPLENGYSLIFKIRGCCRGPHGARDHYQDNTLTVAEQNYFTFARYVDKLIPDYLVTEFARKGLVFLGFSPQEWEDRLIASTVLNKRYSGAEAPYVIGEVADPFERAYWESLNVRQRSISLREFVQNLEAEL